MAEVAVDNDFLIKVCSLALVDEALSVLQVSPEQLLVLDRARFSLRLHQPDKARARYGVAVHARLASLIARTAVLSGGIDDGDLAALLPVVEIDRGERVLFALASRRQGLVVATGDKRSLVALAGRDECREVYDRLRGRIVSLGRSSQLRSAGAGSSESCPGSSPGWPATRRYGRPLGRA